MSLVNDYNNMMREQKIIDSEKKPGAIDEINAKIKTALEKTLGHPWFKINKIELKSDGWMMGNKHRVIELQTPQGYFEIHCDTRYYDMHNLEYGFMLQHKCGGASPLDLNLDQVNGDRKKIWRTKQTPEYPIATDDIRPE